jgi:hypothetical protein
MQIMTPIFENEVMLAGWSETHNGGAKVTFWLADSEALEPFKTMTIAKGKTAGQRLACVLVEIDDNEQPKPEEPKGGAGSVWLALRCKEPQFWEFVQNALNEAEEPEPKINIDSEKKCVLWVKFWLNIESRKEVDTNIEAKATFDKFIRLPYSDWLSGRRDY